MIWSDQTDMVQVSSFFQILQNSKTFDKAYNQPENTTLVAIALIFYVVVISQLVSMFALIKMGQFKLNQVLEDQ